MKLECTRGDRRARYDAAAELTYSYDAANQITNDGFSYDANGNMISDGQRDYTYDSLNRLISVKDPDCF